MKSATHEVKFLLGDPRKAFVYNGQSNKKINANENLSFLDFFIWFHGENVQYYLCWLKTILTELVKSVSSQLVTGHFSPATLTNMYIVHACYHPEY